MTDMVTGIKFTEESYKNFKRKILQQLGFVNQELRRKQDLNLTLKRCGVTIEDLELIGWGYKEESNQIGKMKEVSFEDLKEVGLTVEHKQESAPAEVKQNEIIEVSGNSMTMVKDFDITQLEGLLRNYDVLIEMSEQFKKHRFNSLEQEQNIIIELPNEEDKKFKATYRINKVIHEDFKKFCSENTEFTAKDLISMALKEYMDKYRK